MKRTFAVTIELIRWIANQLRLALLEEGETGTVHGNPGALAALRGETPANLFAVSSAAATDCVASREA